MIKIGITATSSVVPKIEFERGVEFLRTQGFEVEVHPIVLQNEFLYTATDEDRARALIEFSEREDLDAIWCARGGYGATHLLPHLDRWKKRLGTKRTDQKRVKKKTLLGFSDITALLQWYHTHLNWPVIHSPMPSARTFSVLRISEWNAIRNALLASMGLEKRKPYAHSLKAVHVPKGFKGARAPVVGGNLAVWCSMLGTPSQGSTRGKILFLEEIGENFGRINRMLHQLEQAGGLKGCRAIVVGDFSDCKDSVPVGLKASPASTLTGDALEGFLRNPPKEALGFLRPSMELNPALHRIFSDLGARTGIAVYSGLPMGHGDSDLPLVLGLEHTLTRTGKFSLSLKK
jgi:muramoyltetrapeptide carboxypeptidase